MAKKNDGFIVLQRKITSWKWWGNVNAMALWMYLLLNANWAPGYWQGTRIERGSFVTSKSKIAQELDINRKTVIKWLEVFKRDGQIELTGTGRWTVITIVKYDFYQHFETEGGQVNGQVSGQVTGQENGQETGHNRTIITIKQENNKTKRDLDRATLGATLPSTLVPSRDEVADYISRNDLMVDPDEFFDCYEANGWTAANGAPIRSWKAVMRRWDRKEKEKQRSKEELPF